MATDEGPANGELTVQRDGPVLEVVINRPERLNTVTQALQHRLAAIWDDFFADRSLRVAILTATGDRAFCAGSDLDGFEEDGGTVRLPAQGYCGLGDRLGRDKPIIAAVNGLAVGGGFELVLACDLVVASDNAEFGLPEVRIGAAALAGGIPRLCRKIAHTAALGLILTGRRITAADALRLGVVNEVVATGEALTAARRWAADVVRASPLSIELSMAVAERTLRGDDLGDVLEYERAEPRDRMMGSADLQEGVRAFLEKRDPVWTTS